MVLADRVTRARQQALRRCRSHRSSRRQLEPAGLFPVGRAAELWLGPVALLLLVGGEVVLDRICVLRERGLHLCGAHNEWPATGRQKPLPVASPLDDTRKRTEVRRSTGPYIGTRCIGTPAKASGPQLRNAREASARARRQHHLLGSSSCAGRWRGQPSSEGGRHGIRSTHGLRWPAPVAGDLARVSPGPTVSQQRAPLSTGPADGRGDHRRHARCRR